MDKTSLGDRMKVYESQSSRKLLKRTPVILRIDGKAFHTYTRGMSVFDARMYKSMAITMEYLCNNIQNAVLGYTQSDEISILLKDWDTLTTQPWFGNKQTKVESVSASMATAIFNDCAGRLGMSNMAMFDSRAFNIPTEEVCNYFLWRQQDATRNSIQMAGREHFSHKEMHGKSTNDVQHMLITQKDVNWNDLDTWKKRGICYKDGIIDEEIPIFTEDRDYINSLLLAEES